MAAKRDNKGRFKPGQSGNPGGRPKTVTEYRDYALSFTTECIDKLMEVVRNGKDRDAVMAAKEVLDRGVGKPVQEVKQTTTHNLADLAPKIILQDDDDSNDAGK